MTTLNRSVSALRVGDAIPTGTHRAHNTSTASENKIHDDDIARRYGFRGGLVPGATTYAYLAGHLCRVLGPEWAAYGTGSIRLIKPVYEDEMLRLTSTVTSATGDDTRGSVALECGVEGEDRTLRAPGTAGLSWGDARPVEPRPAFATPGRAPCRPEDRGPLNLHTAPVGEPLPPVAHDAGLEASRRYLTDIDDLDPLFTEGSPFGPPLLHPGWYPGIANRALSGNFLLPAWVHTQSEIRHLGPAVVGGTYHAYAEIVEAFEKRGHQYVTADVLIADGNDQPVARMRHTAIVVLAGTTP